MDKVERVLMLFWKLYSGLRISKVAFCFETDINTRTFDRDIEAIRNFLSENYSGQEVVFDRTSNTYYMTGPTRKILTEVEYTAISTILLGSKALRQDEMNGLMKSLRELTEHGNRNLQDELGQMLSEYDGSSHEYAILKMQWDLYQCIKRKVIIKIRYQSPWEEVEEKVIVPFALFFENYSFRLEAADFEKEGMTEYCVDKIESFEIIRKLSASECNQYLKK